MRLLLNFVVFLILFSASLFVMGQDLMQKATYYTLPSYIQSVDAFCDENEYDCEADKTVSPYVLDRFLKGFYKQAEKVFAKAGFELATFEYCGFNQHGCYVDIDRILDKAKHKYYQKVKGGPFLITPIYPISKHWWKASNGERYQISSRIFLYKELEENEQNDSCSAKFLSGQRLPSKISKLLKKNPDAPFEEVIKSAKKNAVAVLRLTLPSLLSEQLINKHGAKFDCLLVQKGDWVGINTVFESKIRTLKDLRINL